MSFGVGLANATNSNTDTSARIHTTARLCLNLYNCLADPNMVRNNKAEFRAIKEEIALGVCRPFNPMGISYAEQRGLAPVITNTAVMNTGKPEDLIKWYVKFYDCRNIAERKQHCLTSCVVKGQAYLPSELYFAGIVISDAEADPVKGDNALTLMIGGKITIKNGHFPIQTSDRVHWYFEEEVEADCFDKDGVRNTRPSGITKTGVEFTNPIPPSQVKIRDNSYAERALMKRPAFIKTCHTGLDGRGSTVGDMSRIIGIACSNAGPYERVDIKLCRQSH